MNLKIHIKYLKYAIIHKWHTFRLCAKRGQIWRGLVHDASKFTPYEWFPYVNYFYGVPDKKAFEYAWNRHQKINPHHWQHWILRPDNGEIKMLEMTDAYIIEMVSDWESAGITQGHTAPNEVQTWYEANKHKMMLHPNTRTKVEKLLKIN